MAKTYMTGWGMRGERTARGGRDGVHCAAQSYDGSVIVSNRYVERDGKEELEIRVGTSDYSSCYSDWPAADWHGIAPGGAPLHPQSPGASADVL